MISRVNLDPAVIDCIVFWTKNPAPMIDKLDRLQDYKYYFQFTLNPYGTELESKLPPLQKRIDTFKRLSDKIGREKVVWRYDPILTNEQYTVTFHQDKFAEMAFALHDYTEKCMLGFIDHYPHVRSFLREFHIEPLIKEFHLRRLRMNVRWSWILVQRRSTYLIWVFRVECALTIG